jgi:hypothetical protein
MSALYTDAPEVKQIARVAFPDYNGNKFKVELFRGPMNLSSYWDGGSRDYYAIVNMSTMRSEPIPQGGSGHGDVPYRMTTLPDSFAVVEHTFYMGKDLGITIYVNQENMSKMLPQGQEISWAEKVVLSATRSLKSSYGGVKDYRFQEALRNTGITKQEWDIAKQSLIQKRMLNAAGAITNDGKNAIGRTELYSLEREKSAPTKTEPSPELDAPENISEILWNRKKSV